MSAQQLSREVRALLLVERVMLAQTLRASLAEGVTEPDDRRLMKKVARRDVELSDTKSDCGKAWPRGALREQSR